MFYILKNIRSITQLAVAADLTVTKMCVQGSIWNKTIHVSGEQGLEF